MSQVAALVGHRRSWWPGAAAGAVRLGLTAVAALYLAMFLELSRPEWAGWTVLSVSLATRADSLEKAVWRVVGTLVGALASTGIVAAFAQDTLAFDVALALWLGLATFLSSVARRQDAYGFALIGYTVPIVTLGEVAHPLSLFGTAVDRCSALTLGIGCASPRRSRRQQRRAWRGGAAAILDLDTSVVDAFSEQPSLRTGGWRSGCRCASTSTTCPARWCCRPARRRR